MQRAHTHLVHTHRNKNIWGQGQLNIRLDWEETIDESSYSRVLIPAFHNFLKLKQANGL